MKELAQSYAQYHQWANHRMVAALKKLTDAQLDEEREGASFGTLRKTLLHLWDTESAWHQRVLLVENVIKPSDQFNGNFEQLIQGWEKQTALWTEWIQKASHAKLDHVVVHTGNGKQYWKSSVIDIIMHVFNHATYHRGQLATMLRQAGVTKIPETDYSSYVISRKM
jgi:uncharacterized damage-inducible protein DinB